MSQLSRTAWEALYGNTGTVFPDNTTGEISEGDMRTFGKNLSDSYVNKTDDVVDEDDMASDSNTKVPTQQSVKAYVDAAVSGGTSREFNRTFTEELLFDKNMIEGELHVQTSELTFTVSDGGNIVDDWSTYGQRITTDGENPIYFDGFEHISNIESGEVLEAGTYQFIFWYGNGIARVSVMLPSSQVANLTPLATPANFTATPDGETDIDLTWDDVSDEVNYLIEFSLNGTSGWTELSQPAAGSTSASHTGLSAGVTRFYRIKAIADGVLHRDSGYATANATTTSSGDVTPPTFEFNPADAVITWTVNRPVTITADEPLQNADGSEITNANVASRIICKQTNSGGANISITATIDSTKKIISVYPATIFGVTQVVYLAIDNVEDVNGNEIPSPESITFTTTGYTYFDGASNRLRFGDILDSIFSVPDADFWLEITIQNHALSGQRILPSKADPTGNQRSFIWLTNGTDVWFYMYHAVDASRNRNIKWTNVLTAGEHELVLKYNGALDTNDGLDRAVLEIDGVVAGSKTLDYSSGHDITTNHLANSTAQLAFGALINAAGNPSTSAFFLGEAKDFIVRSTNGTVVEINVPTLALGTDTSGNGRNGVWV